MIDDFSNKIIRQRQHVARNELALTRERERLRKADVRRKIQLGGLIVKAGLSEEPSSVLFGLLCDAKGMLRDKKEQWRKLGDVQFSRSQDFPSGSKCFE